MRKLERLQLKSACLPPEDLMKAVLGVNLGVIFLLFLANKSAADRVSCLSKWFITSAGNKTMLGSRRKTHTLTHQNRGMWESKGEELANRAHWPQLSACLSHGQDCYPRCLLSNYNKQTAKTNKQNSSEKNGACWCASLSFALLREHLSLARSVMLCAQICVLKI